MWSHFREVVHKTVNTAGQTILPTVIYNALNLNSALTDKEAHTVTLSQQ